VLIFRAEIARATIATSDPISLPEDHTHCYQIDTFLT